MSFPIDRVDQRRLPDDWRGTVVVCDIDRTYLNTRFSSLKGIARIPLEFAVDKRDIAGMVALLHELRRGPGETSRFTPLYFVSASPSQMRPVIERKMLMDGVEYDGTTFKDWGGVLRRGRLGRFREQLGFKLTALLTGRQALPAGARELLIGDDLESDALAYSLYADTLAGRIEAEELPHLLRRLGVARADAWHIADLKRLLADRDGVSRIMIRMERNDDPAALFDYVPHVAACRGALQLAIVAWADGRIGRPGVARVARDLVDRGEDPEILAARLDDCVERALINTDQADELASVLRDAGAIERGRTCPGPDPRWAEARHRDGDAPWTPASLLG